MTESIRNQTVVLSDSHKIKFGHGGTGPFTYRIFRNRQVVPESDKRVRISGYDNNVKLSFAGTYRSNRYKFLRWFSD